MITRRYRIDNMGEIRIAMDFASHEILRIGMESLATVLMIKPRTDMRNRTPLATSTRYDNYTRKNGERVRVSKGTYGAYGNLRKAALTDPVRKVNANTLTFGAHANGAVEYAAYVHEARKPREGQYWNQGMYGRGKGWTTHRTGNKFVQRAVESNADYIPKQTNILIDRKLSEAGA